MSDEGDLDKRKVNIRIRIETCEKVLKKYKLPDDDGDARAFVRALEDATRNVSLTPADYEAITAEVRANYKKRMAKRRSGK